MTLEKLPVEMIREILLRLNDYRDLVNSAQASPVMRTMIDNQCVWQKLCRYHFTDQQLKLAFEGNKFNLVKKQGQQQQQQQRPVHLRGIKYARTTSADGRSSYRSPVVSSAGHQQRQQSRSGQTTGADRQTTRPGGASSAVVAEPKSSYVTNAVRIFDKERSSSAVPSRGAGCAPQRQQSKANERRQPPPPPPSGTPSNDNVAASPANDTARLEIDWERVFHQLRK